jgi:hypothetical protein
MLIVRAILGGALLIWGRKLFWLFVAAAGFLAGWQIAQSFTQNEIIGIVIGILFAIGGALLAMFLKKIAIGVAGFLMGGSVLLSLAGLFNLDQGPAYWGFFLVGGIAGVILIGMFFDLALIWLSSLAGTMLLMEVIPYQGVTRILVFVGILFVGVVIQSSQWRKDDKD